MAVVINGTTGVSGVDGSAGTPSYQGTDSNTGIFFPAADTIAFAEGGVESMRIDSSGNVGIGTSSPSSKLHVVGSSLTNTLRITDGTNYTICAGYLGSGNVGLISTLGGSASLAFGTDSTERMRIDSSGNVGIGSSTINSRLTVYAAAGAGDGGMNIVSGSTTVGSKACIFFNPSTSGSVTTGSAIKAQRLSPDGSTLEFYTVAALGDALAERARITSGGYFKASNTGTYNSSTGAYHEFNQSAQDLGQLVRATNGSYNSSVLEIRCSRAASADYFLIAGRSSDTTDTEFYITGAGNAYADGTWNNNGADYAEFFESANGQALMLGATVVLEGTKVREATAQDDPKNIIGVVRPKEPSKASMVVGNTAWNKWANKYLTDDFDRYIMEDHDVVEWEEQVLERDAVAAVEAVVDEEGNEVSPAVPAQEAVYKTKQHSYESHNIPADVTVPADAVRKTHDDKGNKFQHYKLNPAWDKDAEYVNRENRPEWNIIGLLGQVKILKGQPVGDRWIKMRDVSATVEEWMIR